MAAPPPASSPPVGESTTPGSGNGGTTGGGGNGGTTGGGGGGTTGGGGGTTDPTTSEPTTTREPTTTSPTPPTTTSPDPTTTQSPTDPTTTPPTSSPTSSETSQPSTSDPAPSTTSEQRTTERTTEGGGRTTSEGNGPSTSFVTTTEGTVLPDGSTSFRYKTITAPQSSGSGAAAGHKKSNTGAIVGGVVGGVGGAVLIATLIGLFFWYRRRKNRDVAFDDKMFDPQHSGRHSQADPLDSMAPSVPSVGMPGEPSTIEPFPYEAPHNGAYHESYDGHDYDPSYYSSPSGHHAQNMTMPDARDYMAGGSHFGGGDGGYGNGAMYGAGAAAGAAGAAGAAAKHREAMQERNGGGTLSPNHTGSGRGSNMSHYEDAQGYPSSSGMYQQSQYTGETGTPTPAGGNRTSMLSDGQGGQVYQHTDMMSETTGTDVDEIPPTYTSISPGRP